MRGLVRLLLVVVLVVGALVIIGQFVGSPVRFPTLGGPSNTVGTTGAIDMQKARERGAEIGEKAAVATAKIGEKAAEATAEMRESMGEAGLTTKIKAKMALDDTVKARAINVSTEGSVVTITGTVHTVAEHDRAIALARETTGVTQVVDRLGVQAR